MKIEDDFDKKARKSSITELISFDETFINLVLYVYIENT
jgi:hypothetical protein